MSTTLHLETEKTGIRDKGDNKEPVKWTRLSGRDQYGQYQVAFANGGVAEKLHEEVEKHAVEGLDTAALGLVVELKGAFVDRAATAERKADRHFRISGFMVLSGPAAELAKTRAMAAKTLETVQSKIKAGNKDAAFAEFESFVARLAQMPEPSLDVSPDHVEDATFGDPEPGEPEERALKQLRGEPAPAAEDAAPVAAPVSEPATIPEPAAEQPASEPEPEPEPASAAEAPAEEQPAVSEEAPEEDAPAVSPMAPMFRRRG